MSIIIWKEKNKVKKREREAEDDELKFKKHGQLFCEANVAGKQVDLKPPLK